MPGHLTRGWFLMKQLHVILLVFTFVMMTGLASHADTIEMLDGRKIKGKLISRNASIVTVEVVDSSGKTRRRLLPASQVLSVKIDKPTSPKPPTTSSPKPPGTSSPKPPPTKPAIKSDKRYFVIPIHGFYGLEIQAPLIDRCLKRAKQLKPEAVILEIDSIGGDRHQMFAIIELLAEWQVNENIPLIAFVKRNAFSEAAITAMSVPTVFVAPEAAIGAALITERDENGKVQAMSATRVGEKFSSAYRAKCRTAVEFARNDPLVVDAMLRQEVELSWAKYKNGEPVILRGLPSQQAKSGYGATPQLLVDKNSILTLTAREALDIGAAEAVVADIDEIGAHLDLKGWQPASQFATTIIKAYASKVDKDTREYLTLMAQIHAGIIRFHKAKSTRDSEGMKDSVESARQAVDQILKLAKTRPFIASLVKLHFPNGMESIQRWCDRILDAIKSGKPIEDPPPTKPSTAAPSPPSSKPAPVADVVELMPMIDLGKHATGTWTKTDNGLKNTSWKALLKLPVQQKGDYSLRLEFTRESAAHEAVRVRLPVGDRDVMLKMESGPSESKHWVLERIGEGRRENNPTYIAGGRIKNNIRHRVDIDVRYDDENAAISVDLDQKNLMRWSGARNLLSPATDTEYGQAGSLTVMGFPAGVTFHSIQYRSDSHTPTSTNPALDFVYKDGVNGKAPEGKSIIHGVVRKQKDLLGGHGGVELFRVYDAGAMTTQSLKKVAISGAYGKIGLTGTVTKGTAMYGPYDELPAGEFIAVYRCRRDGDWGDIRVDVATNYKSIAPRHIGKSEMPRGQWVDHALRFSFPQNSKLVEFRMWAYGRSISIDRIYVFRLLSDRE